MYGLSLLLRQPEKSLRLYNNNHLTNKKYRVMWIILLKNTILRLIFLNPTKKYQIKTNPSENHNHKISKEFLLPRNDDNPKTLIWYVTYLSRSVLKYIL